MKFSIKYFFSQCDQMRSFLWILSYLLKKFLMENFNSCAVRLALPIHLIMMKMINFFCCLVDRRKAFSLISSQDHCQRSPLSRIFDTPRAGLEPTQNLCSGLVEWSCAVVITTIHHGATFELQLFDGEGSSIFSHFFLVEIFVLQLYKTYFVKYFG